MGIMEQKECFVGWISGNPPMHFDYQKVDFNKGYFDNLVSKIETFWNENILKGIEPEAQTTDDALQKFPTANRGKSTVVGEQKGRNAIRRKDVPIRKPRPVCQVYKGVQVDKTVQVEVKNGNHISFDVNFLYICSSVLLYFINSIYYVQSKIKSSNI